MHIPMKVATYIVGINYHIKITGVYKKDNHPIVSISAALSDYRGSGYDRGHLGPAAYMKWFAQAMSESFYMSNMSPQYPGL